VNITARYSDGASSSLRTGVLRIDADAITFSDAAGELRFRHADLVIPKRLGSTPRQIDCIGGGLIEVADNDALDAALVAVGMAAGNGWLNALESYWRRVVMLMAVGALVVWAMLVHGVPAAVRIALPSLPMTVDAALGEQVLASLSSPPFDLGESTLDNATRARLLDAWEARIAPQSTHKSTVLFRRGGAIGANALALPGGNLVITDELVALAANDEEILAALAHELGHEEHRHAMQSLVESLTLLAGIALITGDTGSMAVAAPYALVSSSYSREKESEADAFAYNALVAAGIAPSRLGDLLLRLDEVHHADGEVGWSILMSSHPATSDRVRKAAAH
jgi:predicted Zn-dependent protease